MLTWDEIQANAVWKLYGFTPKTHPSEAAVVASLMGLYEGSLVE